jgi:hypothetical protein
VDEPKTRKMLLLGVPFVSGRVCRSISTKVTPRWKKRAQKASWRTQASLAEPLSRWLESPSPAHWADAGLGAGTHPSEAAYGGMVEGN